MTEIPGHPLQFRSFFPAPSFFPFFSVQVSCPADLFNSFGYAMLTRVFVVPRKAKGERVNIGQDLVGI